MKTTVKIDALKTLMEPDLRNLGIETFPIQLGNEEWITLDGIENLENAEWIGITSSPNQRRGLMMRRKGLQADSWTQGWVSDNVPPWPAIMWFKVEEGTIKDIGLYGEPGIGVWNGVCCKESLDVLSGIHLGTCGSVSGKSAMRSRYGWQRSSRWAYLARRSIAMSARTVS